MLMDLSAYNIKKCDKQTKPHTNQKSQDTYGFSALPLISGWFGVMSPSLAGAGPGAVRAAGRGGARTARRTRPSM